MAESESKNENSLSEQSPDHEELAEIRKVFDMLDKNKDKSISRSEVSGDYISIGLACY